MHRKHSGEDMQNQLKRWAIFLLFSVFLVPVGIFLGGWLLAGPYEGDYGLLGLMATIYADALQGSAVAWVTLTGPVLFVLTWLGCFGLQRVIKSRSTPVPGN
jgi:hypothetical protein